MELSNINIDNDNDDDNDNHFSMKSNELYFLNVYFNVERFSKIND